MGCYKCNGCSSLGGGVRWCVLIQRPLILIGVLMLLASYNQNGVVQASLYSADDPVVQLNTGNFESYLVGSQTAWLVEFYAEWCGHCQRFAPIYKQFAREVQGWDGVVRIAALACSDHRNQPVCRRQNVKSYPTVKFFPAHLPAVTHGFRINALRYTVASVRSATLRFLKDRVTQSATKPSLKRFSDVAALQSSVSAYDPEHLLAIVEENAESQETTELAQLVILDLSKRRPDIIVGRVPRSGVSETALVGKQLPALVAVHGNRIQYISQISSRNDTVRLVLTVASGSYSPPPGQNSAPEQSEYEAGFRAPHHHVPRPRAHGDQPSTTSRQPQATNATSPVRVTTSAPPMTTTPLPRYMGIGLRQEDLDSNMFYSLWNEIPNRPKIRGKALAALKEYTALLAKYHPGNERLVSFINTVNSWIQGLKGSIRSEVFLNTIDGLQTNVSYVEKRLDWDVCEGSKSQYRGYPCSLWMTFHALTVGHYEEHLKQANSSDTFDPMEALGIIRKYVKYFFSCRECADHFLEMSRRANREVKRPQDGVLWLWKAHNEVNNRLHGDQTEDPSHPKVQFPSVEACSTCRYDNKLSHERYQNDTSWAETEVLNFLRHFYSPVSVWGNGSSHLNVPVTWRQSTYQQPYPGVVNTTSPSTGANGTCQRRENTWGACSVTCGVGVATRFANNNDLCEMRMEMMLCQLRPCNVQRDSSNHCSATEQDMVAKPLTFNNCTTTTAYRWRYCGECPGFCCEPVMAGNLWAETACGDGSVGKANILWIKQCACRQC